MFEQCVCMGPINGLLVGLFVSQWRFVDGGIMGPGGEIGRHIGLKIRRFVNNGRTGSIPVPGTKVSEE